MKCPKCDSCICVRNGKVGGRQRWRCCDCRSQFVENPVQPQRTGKPCYYCGEPTRKAGTQSGAQRYYCPICNKYWTDHLMPIVPNTIDWYNEGSIG